VIGTGSAARLRDDALDADIEQPGDALEAFRAGWGTCGDLKRVTPAAEPPKYRDALERSGNPKDTREIMVEGRNSG
jgi:hypothetical protein